MSTPSQRPAAIAPRSGDDFAAGLRGFGPVGIIAILLILLGNALFIPASALLVLLWARCSRTPWAEIGYVRPKSWLGTVVVGIGFGFALKLLLKAIIMPLLGADAINQPYHYLVGNRAAIPATLYVLTVGAGFGEETVFRGFMFERLGKLLGRGRGRKVVIVQPAGR